MIERGRVSWIAQSLLWGLAIIAFVILILPGYIPSDPTRAKEAEVKSNVHAIQIALERYCVDHGEYPPYLLGGDSRGWEFWHQQWDSSYVSEMADGRIASNALVRDPLIESGYMACYPINPFASDAQRLEIIAETSPLTENERLVGDPRFGLRGRYMGMCLDDPDWFCGAIQPDPTGWSTIETRRTLDHGDWMNVRAEFKNPGISGYYLFGGRGIPESEAITLSFWPGVFFYRAMSDQEAHPSDESARFGPSTGIHETYQHYILAGYGSEGTEGMDVIRLEPFNPHKDLLVWRLLYDQAEEIIYCGYGYPRGIGTSGGLPEVFGGGDAWNGPQYPYVNPDTSDVIYGAPDGIPDGIILVATDTASLSR
jgi:hypothetical protein